MEERFEQGTAQAHADDAALCSERVLSRVLLPLTIALAAIFGAVSTHVLYSHEQMLRTAAAGPAEEVVRRIKDAEKYSVRAMETLAAKIASESDAERAWDARDHDALLEALLPTFEYMSNELSITHLYVHELEGANFIRVHAPERSGGPVGRWTMQEAIRTGATSSGFEGGKTGLLTLRAVVPWTREGELIGWLELGKEFDAFAAELGEPMLTAVPEGSFSERLKDEQAASGLDVSGTSGSQALAVPYSTSEMLTDLFYSEIVADDQLHRFVNDRSSSGSGLREVALAAVEDRDYAISSARFDDAEGNAAAFVFSLRDVTLAAKQVRADAVRTIIAFGGLCGFVLVVGCIMLWRLDGKLIDRATKLNRAREEAHQALAAKSDFLANMSHEIRTPMTAILGYVDLLADPSIDDAEHAEHVSTIQRNGDHLLTIINDVLDVSRIEAGQMPVEKIDTDPANIVGDVADLLGSRAEENGLWLRVGFDTPMPRTIVSDPTRLRQILLNLVGNGIKFTESGGVSLRVSCDPLAERMTFRVVDTGIGMTPEQFDSVARFEAFVQADSSMSRRFGGTGLGLRISHALAGLLGGGIRAESEVGKGSTFVVTISTGDLSGVEMCEPDAALCHAPAVDAAPSVSASPASDNASGDLPLTGLRVLLAEDGPDNQRLISFHLKRAGAEVTVCGNGLLAAETIERATDADRPHVVLMDMQMPVLDGYSATRRLRDGGCRLPIIAITAHAMDGDRQLCLDAGCDDYLTKPIDRMGLISACERYGRQTTQQLRAA